jgi:WD40 repeat protein
MKRRRPLIVHLVAGLALLGWAAMTNPVLAVPPDAEATNALPANVAEELRRFRVEIEEQGRRIERLYHALGPHLQEMEERAAEMRKQEEEDTVLRLDTIREVADDSLTSLGCANPALPEFAAITTDGGARFYDAQGQPSRALQRPDHHITALAFSPDGRMLLAGTEEGSLLTWSLAEVTNSLEVINVATRVDRVAWLDGTNNIVWAASVSYAKGGEPRNQGQPSGAVLDRATGKVIWPFRSFIRQDFQTFAGAPNGRTLAVLQIPGKPRGAFVLDAASGEILTTLYDTARGPLSVGLSPDGQTVAVGYAPHDIILWAARGGKRLRLLKGHSNWVVSLGFSKDGSRLISGAGDSTARLWDTENGKEIGRIRFPGSSTYVEGVGLSPEADIAFALCAERLVVAKVRPVGK